MGYEERWKWQQSEGREVNLDVVVAMWGEGNGGGNAEVG